jgi:hypothetical protein
VFGRLYTADGGLLQDLDAVATLSFFRLGTGRTDIQIETEYRELDRLISELIEVIKAAWLRPKDPESGLRDKSSADEPVDESPVPLAPDPIVAEDSPPDLSKLPLSEPDKEIVRLWGAGKTDSEIARHVNLDRRTIQNRLSQFRRRSDLRPFVPYHTHRNDG